MWVSTDREPEARSKDRFELKAITRDGVLVLCRAASQKYPDSADINVRRGIIAA
jgi:hypothetical protein